MRPSRKIFIGSSLCLSGVLLQIVIGVLAVRHLEGVTLRIQNLPKGVAPADQMLEDTHAFTAAAYYGGIASWLMIAPGILLGLTGIWQTAKATEHLLAQLPTPDTKTP